MVKTPTRIPKILFNPYFLVATPFLFAIVFFLVMMMVGGKYAPVPFDYILF